MARKTLQTTPSPQAFPKDQCWGSFCSQCTTAPWDMSFEHMGSPITAMPMILSFQPDDSTVSARISACLADPSTWMKDHHLQLNLSKTELLVIPAKESICHNINLKMDSATVAPNKVAKNLGVMIDDHLILQPYCISRPVLPIHALQHTENQTLPNPTCSATSGSGISRLDYCNALLAGLPACAIKPLQIVQNSAALQFGIHSTQKGPCYSSIYPAALATCGCPDQAQGPDPCIQNHLRMSPSLSEGNTKAVCSWQRAALLQHKPASRAPCSL
ncbi:hypothetical protein ACEWY4_023610 [Coilia grayii]|uniref:Uncharacterized protein n=1 Tax=Coilia grayii TaxID=363190 RepID=A0ABD1J3J3_9TELE